MQRHVRRAYGAAVPPAAVEMANARPKYRCMYRPHRTPPTSHSAGYPRSVRDSNVYTQRTRVVPGWLPSANHHSPWACLVSQPSGPVKPLTV